MASRLWLIDAVAATVPADRFEALAGARGIHSIVANKLVSTSGGSITWPIQLVTDQAWPDAMDVGADQLHRMGVTGSGVAVAVVDSGIYFSPGMVLIDGQPDAIRYRGQADFVGQGLCDTDSDPYEQLQYDGYCFRTYRSVDGYGHGSHVAGIIGNRCQDQATGVYLGIAPDASILSIRVLGDDGGGSYADVIEGIQYVIANKSLFGIRVMNLSLSAKATTPYFVDPLDRAVEKAWAAGLERRH